MNLRPSVIFAVLSFVIAIILALVAYDRNNNLEQERLLFATERVEIANQALDEGATQAAGTRSVEETQAAETVAGVRNAASTLQAGSLATREGLQESLAEAGESATQNAAAAATADARAQTAQEALESTATAQAEQLVDAQAAIEEAATRAVVTAESMATQQAMASTLEADLSAAQTEIAVMAANPPTLPPTPSASAPITAARPSASVTTGQLLYVDNFDTDSNFAAQDVPGAGSSRVENGQLVLTTIEQPQRELTLLTQGTITDALVEIEITSADCSEQSLLLLEVRDDAEGNNGYAIGVNCAYNVWGIFNRNAGQIERLVTQPIADTISDPNTAHVLSVEARADTLTLYLDDERLGSIGDSSHAEGSIGFTLVADSAATVRLDNLRAWALGTPPAGATATPQPVDSRIPRDAFVARLPAQFDAGQWTWRAQGEPSLDLNELQLASTAILIDEAESGIRAGIIVIYGTDTQIMMAMIDAAEVDLEIERFDEVPADFPEPNIFGRGRDGLDTWWVQGVAVVRVTIIDTENVPEEELIALARTVRDLVAGE
ncbi:MAG: hypothetical protein IH587_11360 [Anaerolineae bacterium]|nr:hypothetical protein [Anaerolineae bacterium]